MWRVTDRANKTDDNHEQWTTIEAGKGRSALLEFKKKFKKGGLYGVCGYFDLPHLKGRKEINEWKTLRVVNDQKKKNRLDIFRTFGANNDQATTGDG